MKPVKATTRPPRLTPRQIIDQIAAHDDLYFKVPIMLEVNVHDFCKLAGAAFNSGQTVDEIVSEIINASDELCERYDATPTDEESEDEEEEQGGAA